jgi:hypothetical protein
MEESGNIAQTAAGDFKVLVACEESQTVCKAFRELGIEAYSCDIQECSGGHPEWHIQGDAVKEAYSGKIDNISQYIVSPASKTGPIPAIMLKITT